MYTQMSKTKTNKKLKQQQQQKLKQQQQQKLKHNCKKDGTEKSATHLRLQDATFTGRLLSHFLMGYIFIYIFQ